MPAIHYLDFDLSIESIEPSQTRYRVRVLNSPAGQASAEFDLPFSDLELENFLLRVGRTRRGVRWVGSPEMSAAKTFGSRLFDAVFQDQIQVCLLRSLDLSKQQAQGLRLRLRLTHAPSLGDLPWEYLYDTTSNRFFCHATATPLVRYLELPQTTQPLTVQPPLKVLVMISSPQDRDHLDVETEWNKVQSALADLEKRALVTLTRLPVASLAALQRQLRREQYHIFHFVGHGGFDRQNQDGVLLLETENGLSRLVSGNYLGTLLHNHPTLRLAVLNACEGARTTPSDPFAGVAQNLVRQGIPAVIGMQFEITDKAAITLAQEFYTALADGYPVDAALSEARVAIFTEGNDIEWGTPVLYMRSVSGQLFDVTGQVAAADSLIRPPLINVPIILEPAPSDQLASIHTEANKPVGQRSLQLNRWSQVSIIIAVLALSLLLAVLWPQLPLLSRLLTNPKNISPTATTAAITESLTPDLTSITEGTATEIAFVTLPLATATITDTIPSTLAPTATVPLQSTSIAMQLTLTATVPTVQQTQTLTSTPATGTESINSKDGAVYIYVSAGSFLMGSTEEQIDVAVQDCQQFYNRCTRDLYIDETPQHTVTLDAFWIMQTEVTNAQYNRCVAAGICTKPNNNTWNIPENAQYPVTHVNWNQATSYATWVGGQLPTEAQWEKAARSDDGRIYPWGNTWDGNLLNFCDNKCTNDWKDASVDDGYAKTAPIGTYPQGASFYHTQDMVGNVWEWVADWYAADYYTNLHEQNPSGPKTGKLRALRGGSWFARRDRVRIATRNGDDPNKGDDSVGFRVVLVVSPES